MLSLLLAIMYICSVMCTGELVFCLSKLAIKQCVCGIENDCLNVRTMRYWPFTK